MKLGEKLLGVVSIVATLSFAGCANIDWDSAIEKAVHDAKAKQDADAARQAANSGGIPHSEPIRVPVPADYDSTPIGGHSSTPSFELAPAPAQKIDFGRPSVPASTGSSSPFRTLTPAEKRAFSAPVIGQ